MSPARILEASRENIRLAADLIKRGELVGMPTETVYGLAGNALDPNALARIFAAKERPTFDPLIVHVHASVLHAASPLEELARQNLVDETRLAPAARAMIDKLVRSFWPGALTLVLPKHERVPLLATSGLNTVGLRSPNHPVAQSLIEAAGTPLAAPSANRFGRISPTQPEHVVEELGDRLVAVLDGGPCAIGIESTVLAVSDDGELRLLRPGGVPVERIADTTGVPVASAPRVTGAAGSQVSPGQLESHYAPQKPLHLLPRPLDQLSDEQLLLLFEREPKAKIGVLALRGDEQWLQDRLARVRGVPASVRVLSRTGSLEESARNLFTLLRALDASDATVLFAEPCTAPTGLGYAIADRLKRAAAPRTLMDKP